MARRRKGILAELERQRRERQAEQARLQRQNERFAAQVRREREQAEREAQPAVRQAEKDAAAARIAARQQEAQNRTAAAQARLSELQSVLPTSLRSSVRIPFSALRRSVVADPFRPGSLGTPEPEPQWTDHEPKAGRLQRLLFSGRTQKADREARARFDEAVLDHQRREQERLTRLRAAEKRHAADVERQRREVEQMNARIARLEQNFAAGDPDAVKDYLGLVLQRRHLPAKVPAAIEVAYQADARRLLIVRELPGVDIIPREIEYKYVRTRDEIDKKLLPVRELKQHYSDLVGQLVLITMRDAFDSAPRELIGEVAVSAHVSTRNKATGQPERPCLVSVMASREQFDELVLTELDPGACLRHLDARMSAHPCDLEAVRPVFDPDLSKYKFVDEHDAAAGLDARPVLLDLHPSEFEHLVRQLFEAMGMKAMVTQPSRDDGIDGVAVNEDPIMGGVCVIQAKRYRGVVPAEAVRALAGVMGQKKASRGVLIATSWFGKATHDFAADHGRIQLIDGPQLKHLLKEHLGRDVVIGELKRRRS